MCRNNLLFFVCKFKNYSDIVLYMDFRCSLGGSDGADLGSGEGPCRGGAGLARGKGLRACAEFGKFLNSHVAYTIFLFDVLLAEGDL